ncbi:hypothetical protein ABPG73_006317 [Tetrahymena malaccensis]
MANLLEENSSVKPQSSLKSQNYLRGYLLCDIDDISNEQKINKQIPNKQVEEKLINEEEDILKKSNLDITIKKKTQVLISRFTKQQNLKEKYQSIFNIQYNQFAIILNSDPFKNTQSLSFTSQNDLLRYEQSQQNNDSQLNKQSQGNKDFENNTRQQSQKIILSSNQSLKYNFDQIQEQMVDELKKQISIQQIVVEQNISDYFNQNHVLAYKESSQSQSDKDMGNNEYFNDIDENISFKQSFTELMCQIELDLISKYYYLTDFVQSFEYEDIYLGYQNKDNIKSQTLLFKIIYNPSQENRLLNRQKIQNLNKDLDNKESETTDLIDLRYQCQYQDDHFLFKQSEDISYEI